MAPPPKRRKLLSSSRPKHSTSKPQLSSRTTRTLIRSHHTLHKQLSHALATNDTTLATSLQAHIEAQGGLDKYQQASIQGQSSSRGGDSSKVLVDWIVEHRKNIVEASPPTHGKPSDAAARRRDPAKHEPKLRMLEVGALRTDNACARSGLFDMTRIDLNSQHKDILAQDLMQRPVPLPEMLKDEGFDVVSLSLVVNYVGDAAERGEMLKRVAGFLRPAQRVGVGGEVQIGGYEEGMGDAKWAEETGWKDRFAPGVFLVLPAPCVLNSRYLDEERLEEIMVALRYEMVCKKLSSKLVYYYWRFLGQALDERLTYRKTEVRKGKDRNNFAIILR